MQGISDDELEASLSGLLGAGARVEARIVAHLAEVEARRLHLLAGYSSLYDYCRKRLGLSDYEAFIRIAAARVARKYPVVFEMLERRALHLTAICEVREFLTTENHRELFEAVSGKTKLQIREVLAQRFPRADVPASLKRLPMIEPLSPGRYRLQLTLSAEQKEKLELARDLLSHANSSGDLAIVVERALDELISRLEKRRFGRAQSRPARERAKASASMNGSPQMLGELNCAELHVPQQPAPRAPAGETLVGKSPVGETPAGDTLAGKPPVGETLAGDTLVGKAPAGGAGADKGKRRRKHIAQETRRDLVTRDGVHCAFIGSNGQRCEARAFLQFHHRRPWARGGCDTADNMELLCRSHNLLLAERDFGRTYIDAAIAARKANPRE